MPTKKRRKSRTKSFASKEKYTAELSSGQLVIGVCILMLFGLTCFLLGLLAGRFDTSPAGAAIASAPAPIVPTETAPQATARARAAVESPNRRRVSPPPAPETPAAAPEPEKETVEAAAAPPPPEIKPVLDVPDYDPAEQEEDAPSAPAITALAENPAPRIEPVPTLTQKSPAELEIDRGNYFSVQIGAYSDKKNARSIIDNIEGKSEYKAQLIDSPSGRLVIVLVGKFSNRPDAEKARAFLRDQLGFKDCFVKRKAS